MTVVSLVPPKQAERKTPQHILDMLDAIRAEAEAGVISAIAATWIVDGDVVSNFGYEAGSGMALNGAVHSLALEVNHDMTFED